MIETKHYQPADENYTFGLRINAPRDEHELSDTVRQAYRDYE